MKTRTAIVTTLIVLLMTITVRAGGNTGTVTEVLEGDLVRFGDSFVVHFTGITAPSRDEPLGEEIFEFTKRELEGKLVKLFTWTTDNTAAGIVRDEEGRAFVQIHYGEDLSLSFNEVLLEKGFARADEKHLPDDLKERYLELERKAMEKGLGIWGIKKQKCDD